MKPAIQALFAARDSDDAGASHEALRQLFQIAEEPVDWAYEVWDSLLRDLSHEDHHKRSFSAQMLTRLAISDPDRRMLRDFPAMSAVMRDERFVTARHTLQSLWRVGLAGPDRAALVVEALETRFAECSSEKNGSLTRTDAVAALGRLAKANGGLGIEARVEALIASEPDEKARKKQKAAWRKALRE